MNRPANVIKVNTGLYTCYRRLGLRSLFTGRVRKGIHVVIEGNSDHYPLEAWERMTQGGLKVRETPFDDPSPFGRPWGVWTLMVSRSLLVAR